jgi:hypothetical protein
MVDFVKWGNGVAGVMQVLDLPRNLDISQASVDNFVDSLWCCPGTPDESRDCPSRLTAGNNNKIHINQALFRTSWRICRAARHAHPAGMRLQRGVYKCLPAAPVCALGMGKAPKLRASMAASGWRSFCRCRRKTP